MPSAATVSTDLSSARRTTARPVPPHRPALLASTPPVPLPKPVHIPPGTIRQAIGWYLGHLQLAETTRLNYQQALRSVFAPVLGEKLAVLTADQVETLRHLLAQRVSRRTAMPYSQGTIVLYWTISRKFSRWCWRQGWLAVDHLAGIRGSVGGDL